MSMDFSTMESNSLVDTMIVSPFNYIVSFGSYIPEEIENYITDINQSTEHILTKILNSNNSTELQEITRDLNINLYNNLINFQRHTYITLFLLTIGLYCLHKCINYYANYTYLKNLNCIREINDKNIKHIFHTINENPNKITSGIFIDSLKEIEANNKYIINQMKFNKTHHYYILLRIKTRHPIEIIETKYNLRHDKTSEGNKMNSYTNDNYMLMKINFNYEKYNNDDIKIKDIIINNINFLNYLSNDAYKNKDFIVLAISNSQNHFNVSEFFNGLFNIKYENFNIKNIMLNASGIIGFILLLPTKKVYDMYMDVFNNVIFESTAYKIDNDNNEYWYSNDLKEVMKK